MHQGEQGIIEKKQNSFEEDQLEIKSKLELLNQTKEIQIQRIFKADGHTGILLQTDGGKDYIIHKNNDGKIIILNAKYMCNDWQKQKKITDDDGEDETKAKKERLDTIMKTNPLTSYLTYLRGPPVRGPNFVPEPLYLNTAASNLGSSLGYCLANINNYKSPGEFMRDFGFNATMNGTISVLADRIPIIGTLFLLGGLGWTSLKLYGNRTANNNMKIIKASQIAISTGTSIGGSIGGAIMGEVFIPIPVLGALVGGFIGSLVGGTGSSFILKTINKQKYIDMVEKLENNITEEGYWDYSRLNLNNLGITNAFFQSSIPEDLEHEYPNVVWITMNIVAFLTIHHTQRDEKKHTQFLKRSQKLDKIEQNKEIETISKIEEDYEENIYFYKKIPKIPNEEETKEETKEDDQEPKSSDEESEEEDEEDNNKWPSTIDQPQQWLLKNKIYTQYYLPSIEKFVGKILSDT